MSSFGNKTIFSKVIMALTSLLDEYISAKVRRQIRKILNHTVLTSYEPVEAFDTMHFKIKCKPLRLRKID